MKKLKRLVSQVIIASLIPGLCLSGVLPTIAWAQAEPEPEAPAPLAAPQLDELVAPVALYPDGLVAQVLAASTYPSQVTEAYQWVQSYPGLTGSALAAAVDTQPWDPSVKALTEFPSVLAKLNNNLSWTSALGQAYYYQPQDVLAAVQRMRNRAYAARSLVSTPQQRVIVEGGTVIIEPVDPSTVYVPEYNPTAVYGAPVPAYPGYSGSDLLLAGLLGFGAGILVGAIAEHYAWGWHGWGADWHHHNVIYENNVYISRTTAFYAPNRGYWSRPVYAGRPGYAGPRAYIGPRPGPEAFHRPPEAGGRGAPGMFTRPAENARPEVARGAGAGGQPFARPEGPAHEMAPRPAEMPSRGAERAAAPAPRPQVAAAESFRGFGKAPATGMNRSAFAGYSAGGEARAATVRGRSSMQTSEARASAPHGGGGGTPHGGGGGGAPHGGGGGGGGHPSHGH